MGVVYFGVTLPVRESVGQETAIRLAYDAIVDLRLDVAIAYSAAALFGVLWRRERQTRIKAVARKHVRVVELEQQVDPQRTSSEFKE